MENKSNKHENQQASNVKVIFAGGDGLQDANRILAKIIIKKLQDKEKENESSNLHQG